MQGDRSQRFTVGDRVRSEYSGVGTVIEVWPPTEKSWGGYFVKMDRIPGKGWFHDHHLEPAGVEIPH